MISLLLAVTLGLGVAPERPTVVYVLAGAYSTKAERLEIRALRRQRIRVRVVHAGRFDPITGVRR